MPEKLARSVVVTPCCRHHSLTERPLLRHSWICVAHSCSSARCFNSALVILTPHNTTVAKPFATFRYYCLMCVYARLGLTVTFKRLVTIMLTLSVAVSLVAFPVAAVDYSDVVAPLYIGLEDATADLAISSNGYANCSGSAYVANGYNATVVMELQQKNGTWKPIKRWSKSGGYVSMNESYRVSSKYYYRVAVTAKVYNSSGSLVESKTSYSGEVYY